MLKPKMDSNRDHVFGCWFAQVQLVEYGDFQCPHCATVYPEIKMLQEIMGSQMMFAFRHYPSYQLHNSALDAAVVSEVASLQDKFWNMHDMIFENQKFLTRASLKRFAEDLEIDLTLFENKLTYKKIAQLVIADFDTGVLSGVNGTPTFFINGLRYNGTPDFKGLVKACRYVLMLKNVGNKQPAENYFS